MDLIIYTINYNTLRNTWKYVQNIPSIHILYMYLMSTHVLLNGLFWRQRQEDFSKLLTYFNMIFRHRRLEASLNIRQRLEIETRIISINCCHRFCCSHCEIKRGVEGCSKLEALTCNAYYLSRSLFLY